MLLTSYSLSSLIFKQGRISKSIKDIYKKTVTIILLQCFCVFCFFGQALAANEDEFFLTDVSSMEEGDTSNAIDRAHGKKIIRKVVCATVAGVAAGVAIGVLIGALTSCSNGTEAGGGGDNTTLSNLTDLVTTAASNVTDMLSSTMETVSTTLSPGEIAEIVKKQCPPNKSCCFQKGDMYSDVNATPVTILPLGQNASHGLACEEIYSTASAATTLVQNATTAAATAVTTAAATAATAAAATTMNAAVQCSQFAMTLGGILGGLLGGLTGTTVGGVMAAESTSHCCDRRREEALLEEEEGEEGMSLTTSSRGQDNGAFEEGEDGDEDDIFVMASSGSGQGNDGFEDDGDGEDDIFVMASSGRGQGNDGFEDDGEEGNSNKGKGEEGNSNKGEDGDGNKGKGKEGNSNKEEDGDGNKGEDGDGNKGKGEDGDGNKGEDGDGKKGKGEDGDGNKGEDGDGKKKHPPGKKITVSVCVHQPPSSASLLQRYNHNGQLSSLHCVQGLLLETSEQVLVSLKTLAMRASEEKKEQHLDTTRKLSPPLVGPLSFNKIKLPVCSPIRMFSSIQSYTTNLERKYRSKKMGVIADLTQGLSLGLAYNYSKDPFKEHPGISLGSSTSLVKAKTEAESVSAILTLNPYKSAFTAHVAMSYGWGKLKSVRKVFHNNTSVETKGSPDITLTGGLLQLNYTIPVSSMISLSPFVEGSFSRVGWNGYKENFGLLPCRISRNKETLLECSVGIRNRWKLTDNTQIQTLVTNIFGHRDLTNMSLQPIHTSLAHHHISIPSKKLAYSRVELWLMYDLKYTDSFWIGLQGKAQVTKRKNQSNQHITLSFQYFY